MTVIDRRRALEDATGVTQLADDLPAHLPECLHAAPVVSPHRHARVRTLRTGAALAVAGVVRVLTGADVRHVEGVPLAIARDVLAPGQAVAWVLAETPDAARRGADAVGVDHEVLPAVTTLDEAVAAETFEGEPVSVARGDAAGEMRRAAHVVEGRTEIVVPRRGGPSPGSATARLDETGRVLVHSTTPSPVALQEALARTLGLAEHDVVVESVRALGEPGDEVTAHEHATVAALGVRLTGRPVHVRGPSPDGGGADVAGGHAGGHAARVAWRAGLADDGALVALEVELTVDGGSRPEPTAAVVARALAHLDGGYEVAHVEATGRVVRTHRVAPPSGRGDGAFLGSLVIEDVLGRYAPVVGLDPVDLRARNRRRADRSERAFTRALDLATLAERRAAAGYHNATHEHRRRGLAVVPVAHRVAGPVPPSGRDVAAAPGRSEAQVRVHPDGSVLLRHGAAEAGRGRHDRLLLLAARSLRVSPDLVRTAPVRTDGAVEVPAPGGDVATAAAVEDACRALMAALGPVRLAHPDDSWEQLVRRAAQQGAVLTATGHATTGRAGAAGGAGAGPVARAVAVAEVEVDSTGAHRVLRVDVVHDVGEDAEAALDRADVESGLATGLARLDVEAATPDDVRVTLLPLPPGTAGPDADGPLLDAAPVALAVAAREALRAAVASWGPAGHVVELPCPTTSRAVFGAIRAARAAASADVGEAGGTVAG